jgi:hypothetical protein
MWRIFGGGRQAPVVDKVEPDKGPVAGGIKVTISGRGFNGASAVHFGEVKAAFQVNSDAEIVVPSLPPAKKGGKVEVKVTAAGRTSTGGSCAFEYLPAPVITSVECAGDARTVRIVGKDLVDVRAVYFETEPAECFEESDGGWKVRRHRGRTGAISVTVVTPGGTSAPVTVSFPADKVRGLVTVVSLLYMLCLIAGLLVYINWPTFKEHVPATIGPLPLAVPWFGAVGAVALSISGVVDHFSDWDSSYAVWHLVRPVIGAVTGSVGALIIISGVIASTGSPSLNSSLTKDIFYDLVAFLAGYREETFRSLIKRITDVIVGPGTSTSGTPATAAAGAATPPAKPAPGAAAPAPAAARPPAPAH